MSRVDATPIILEPTVFPAGDAQDVETAFAAFADLPFVLFFDSAARSDPVHARASYLTACPRELIRARGDRVETWRRRGDSLAGASYELEAPLIGDPLEIARSRLERYRAVEHGDAPPFQGGLAGLLGYDLARSIERLPAPLFDEFETPDLAAGVFDWVLAFDHQSDRALLIVQSEDPVADAARLDALRREIEARLESPPAPIRAHRSLGPRAPLAAPTHALPGEPRLASNFSRDSYLAAVRAAIEYIAAGDIFQANLSQRLVHPLEVHPVEFYRRLRQSNPAPFAAYFDLGDAVVASSSPEQFLSLAGRGVVTRPIKGTRSRGYTPEEDSYRGADLAASAKDRAENVMIVDLLRNDLSRVCLPGSISVPRLFELERHPTVHHLVSEVRGELRPGHSAIDLLRASFPGGSITGAPKVRAMEIIAELERTARGAYCGSLAWIAFHGAMGSNILIRTATLSRGWIQMPVGGGIVADSVPEREYEETLHKAAGMLRAL